MKRYTRFIRFMVLLMPTIFLSGCLDNLSIPIFGFDAKGAYLTYLRVEGDAADKNANAQLVLLTPDGDPIPLEIKARNVVAFAWHPTKPQLAYVAGAHTTSDPRLSLYIGTLPDNPSGEVVLKPEQLNITTDGHLTYITEMHYSPRGNALALATFSLPNTIDPNLLLEGLMEGLNHAFYWIDLNTKQVNRVSDSHVANIAWSPSGKYIAYTTWRDSNNDGEITFNGVKLTSDYEALPADNATIGVFDVTSGETVWIGDEAAWQHQPLWLDENTLAFLYQRLDTSGIVTESGIRTATLPDLAIQTLFRTTDTTLYSAALSPDQTQIAYLDFPTIPMAPSEEMLTNLPPSHLNILAVDRGELRTIPLPAEETFFDNPLWSRDGSQIFLGTANLGSRIAKGDINDLTTYLLGGETSTTTLYVVEVAAGTVAPFYADTALHMPSIRLLMNFLVSLAQPIAPPSSDWLLPPQVALPEVDDSAFTVYQVPFDANHPAPRRIVPALDVAPDVTRGLLEGGIPYIGDLNAPIVVALFSDFSCPHCTDALDTLVKPLILNQVRTGQVRLEWYPMTFVGGTYSETAARGALCGGEQGAFWEFQEVIFSVQKTVGAHEFTPEVMAEIATRLGLDAIAWEACFSDQARGANALNISDNLANTLGVGGVPSVFVRRATDNTWTNAGHRYEDLMAAITPLLEE